MNGKVLAALAFGFAALAAGAASGKSWGGGRHPRGKGVFIDNLVAEGQNPQHLIERLQYLGMSWIAIEIAWYGAESSPPKGKRSGPPNSWGPGGARHNLDDGSLMEFVPALVAAGIDVWVWGFPSPDRTAAFVDNVKEAYAQAPQISGVIPDPEMPYYGSAFGPALEDLISRLQDLGKPVGVTTYGGPFYHPNFPYEAITGANFGMPQIYSELGPNYPPKAIKAWRDLGFDVVIPLNGASSIHKPAGLTAQAEASRSGNDGLGWWNYRHIILVSDSKRAGRVEAIRAFKIGPPPGTQQPAAPAAVAPGCSMSAIRSKFGFTYWATGGAKWGDNNPTVILYHGMGSKPSAWPQFIGTNKPAKFIAARGFNSYGSGRAWWPTKAADPDQTKLANQMAWAGEEARKLIHDVKRCAGGPLVLAGHSQGGMMALVAGQFSRPDVEMVVAGSAWLPVALQGDPIPPTYLIHGDDDTTVSYTRTRDWAQNKPGISWISVDGGHSLSGEVLANWTAALDQSI